MFGGELCSASVLGGCGSSSFSEAVSVSEFIPCINCSGVPRSATRVARSSVAPVDAQALLGVPGRSGTGEVLSSSCSSSAITFSVIGSAIESIAIAIGVLARSVFEVLSTSSSESVPKRASSVFLFLPLLPALQVDVPEELLLSLELLLLLLSLSEPLLLLTGRLLVKGRSGFPFGFTVVVVNAGGCLAGRVVLVGVGVSGLVMVAGSSVSRGVFAILSQARFGIEMGTFLDPFGFLQATVGGVGIWVMAFPVACFRISCSCLGCRMAVGLGRGMKAWVRGSTGTEGSSGLFCLGGVADLGSIRVSVPV